MPLHSLVVVVVYRNHKGKSNSNGEAYHTDEEDDEQEKKSSRLLEMFPQLTRTDVMEVSRGLDPSAQNTLAGSNSAIVPLISCFSQYKAPCSVFQVIGSTGTLDGAVAACLLKFGDKEGELILHLEHIMKNTCLISHEQD